MALVQKKRQKKERRALWPLLLSVVFSVSFFLLVLGVSAFLTRDDDVKGKAQKEPESVAMTLELPPALAELVSRKVQELGRPCVQEAIRLDPAAASKATVRAKIHLAANGYFLKNLSPEGFSSLYFQRCLLRVTWPDVSLQEAEGPEELPVRGQAFQIIDVKK